ncbi:MAG: hypothetical protein U9N85_06860, partial [Bacteroidota bacterium]|nr:hypothetical protein [Bacteroidota bacterium]
KTLKYIDDDWIWAYDLGKCDGTGVGKDASDIITEEVNGPGPVSHLYGYYTDVNYYGGAPRGDEEDFPGYDGPELMFWYETGEPNPSMYYCINSYDMNTYTYETEQVLNYIINDWYAVNSDKTLIKWFCSHDFKDDEDGNVILYHPIRTWFGIPHVVLPAQ